MSNYDNTNQGVLFKNDRKESDNHPDYRGDINVAGTDYWISAWLNESKKGTKYMKLSVTQKDEAHKQGSQQARKAVDEPQPGDVALGPDDFDDQELPF